ncbi:hypothetical protein DJ568_04950 [Mucilaginibacter hurinus]|uniref:TonB C-terminal domain-containing protein n=1 Tax=Mucilaginibacter hurinus TaxID=2201324 RepID=A0A367GSN8_9SPHI|nr:TonB family protein [Mucilaginibacter hurinus]RCH56095.1 hypothetical protein DJ568_04950 [Mucilaginibacter hurinus]
MLRTLLFFLLVIPVLICKAQSESDTLKKHTPGEDDVYTAVDVAPEFPGGPNEFSKFLARNTRYPARARERNVQGRVFVTFIVEKNGVLSNIAILKRLGWGYDEEVIRVLTLSPRWKPGTVNNEPVRVRCTIPVAFNLANGETKTEPIKLPATDTLVQYYKYPAQLVHKKEDADYITLIYPPYKSNPRWHQLRQYYKTGKIKFNGFINQINGNLYLTGTGIDYYQHGFKKSVTTYNERERKDGKEYLYYPNGKLHSEREHDPVSRDWPVRYIECRDSLGNVMTVKGDGQWIEYDELFSKVTRSGPVKNKVPHGEWTIWENDSTQTVYILKNGIKESVKLFLRVENEFHAVDDLPMYKGSLSALNEYVKKNVKYPQLKDSYSDVVYLAVTATPNGQLSNIDVEQSSKDVFNEEAIRIIRSSGPWVSKVTLTKPLKLKIAIKFKNGTAALEYVRL